MSVRVSNELSHIEREVIAAIRSIRGSEAHELRRILSDDPAQLMHHFILATHGHVKFRLAPIANELAVEMRTLQRDFVRTFKTSMHQCKVDERLSYSKIMLRATPPTKMSVIASTLGYDTASDFVRFFEHCEHKTPSAWRRAEQIKVEQEERTRVNKQN